MGGGAGEPDGESSIRQTDIVIGCVDTRAARAVIERQTSHNSAIHYAIDIGNSESSGQFILGEPLNAVNRRSRTRLRTAAELFPEIIDATLDNDGQPSCSAIEALERQQCFVNSVLAQHALALLARLFRYGEISYHGSFVDVASSRAVPLAVDPLLWRQIRKRRTKKHKKEDHCRRKRHGQRRAGANHRIRDRVAFTALASNSSGWNRSTDWVKAEGPPAQRTLCAYSS